MGTSFTARYSDGQSVYGVHAAWPPDLRKAWPTLMVRVADGFRALHRRPAGADPPLATSAPTVRSRVRVPIREVLTNRDLHGVLARLARAHGVDEAEVAWLWAASGGSGGRTTRRTVEAKLRLHRELERLALHEAGRSMTASGRRVGQATRLAVRTLLLKAVASLDPLDTPDPDEWAWWSDSRDGRAFLAQVLSRAPPGTSPVTRTRTENAQ